MGKRFGIRWAPPGSPEQINWYASRSERDEHYGRVRQAGHRVRKVAGKDPSALAAASSARRGRVA